MGQTMPFIVGNGKKLFVVGLLIDGLDPKASHDFVALGQGVNSIPDPVFSGRVLEFSVEGLLSFDVSRIEFICELRNDGAELIDFGAGHFVSLRVFIAPCRKYEGIKKNDLEFGVRLATLR